MSFHQDSFHQKHTKADKEWRYRTGDRGYTDAEVENIIIEHSLDYINDNREKINYFVKEMEIQLVKALKNPLSDYAKQQKGLGYWDKSGNFVELEKWERKGTAHP